jgi:NADP-dependent 3-hydroxy acid dehydrogenase YdfG
MGTRRTELCEELAARLRSAGAAAFVAPLNLADPLSINRFVKSADYLIGALDVLVSAAGLADGTWVGAQHLVAQVVPPMIDNRRGDVVLVSPELVGTTLPGAQRMLEAWAGGLEAEFVGTGVRASIVRSATHVPPDDAGCLIATVLGSPGMHLRVVDVIPPVPAPTLAQERRGR